ncbi:MAG: DUF4124 domain-containing protein [Candidatus Tectimicrobiota bacterium]
MPGILPYPQEPARTGTLLVCLLLPALVLAQDLYTCTTADGRRDVRDTPCPLDRHETRIERQEPSAPPPDQAAGKARRASRPSAVARQTYVPSEPEIPLKECVHVNDVATTVSDSGRFRYQLHWKVELSNRCTRPRPITLTFGLYDKNDFEIRATQRRLRLPARDGLTARGTLQLSQNELQRISAKKADVQLR